MKKLYCAVCGKEIENGAYAIRVADVWNLDEEKGYIHEECATEWLEQQCEVVEVNDELLNEIFSEKDEEVIE